jgi:hypothetical protein
MRVASERGKGRDGPSINGEILFLCTKRIVRYVRVVPPLREDYNTTPTDQLI